MSVQGNRELIRSIVERIRNHPLGAISFREFMELCLYDEHHGYYRSDRLKIGKGGDFYTSASVGTVMGGILASYIASQWPRLKAATGGLSLVEFGGGSGRLAAQVMDALQERFDTVYKSASLTMVETSPFHRALQCESLAGHASKVEWMSEEEWLACGKSEGSLVFANELLDAFPVHVLEGGEGGVPLEVYVEWDEEESRFAERLLPLTDTAVAQALAEDGVILERGQRVEISLDAPAWVQRVASRLQLGTMLLIDYGDTASRLYASHRARGTLLAYRRHEATERWYDDIGEQDLTAHVNFTACERAARRGGAGSVELLPQREFLMRCGVLELLQNTYDPNPFSPAAKRNRAVRQLLLDDGFGELFKVMIVCK
ncbi:class I SAM-dependent methyltransferase [Paenibacillus chartarius]|uniref:Class I SAM-dependent methyltransferase n=1 Tax=Paenibacillus chartarius TaxID=747481 RepID=A0ABV6DUJ3_9BACL